MGSYDGGSKELNKALDDLRGNFGPSDYNLVRKNCNAFCNALVLRLLQKPIPSYINRLAQLGNCCSCLLPKQLLEDAPVGGSGNNRNTGNQSFLVPTHASMNRGSTASTTSTGSSFSGQGYSLGGGGSSSSSSKATGNTSDLVDRREKARKAALARLERNQQPQSSTTSPPSSLG